MNLITTDNTKIITADMIKYGTAQDLTLKTQEEKTALTRAVDKTAKAFIDEKMTTRILEIHDEIAIEVGQDKATEYINSAKGIVSDVGGRIDKKVMLISAITTVDAEVVDDPRVKELTTENEKLRNDMKIQYEDDLVKQAILNKDLANSEAVLKKLQSGDDITQALKESEKLRSLLGIAEEKASKVGTLRSEADQHREALANAKTLQANLKMQIQQAKDEGAQSLAKVANKSGEALLTYTEKANIKAEAGANVATKIRAEFTLQDFLIENGMSRDDINHANSNQNPTVYPSSKVDEIASLIFTQRNEVTETVLVDKIEALIADALTYVSYAEITERHNTLKSRYTMEVKAMTANAIEALA